MDERIPCPNPVDEGCATAVLVVLSSLGLALNALQFDASCGGRAPSNVGHVAVLLAEGGCWAGVIASACVSQRSTVRERRILGALASLVGVVALFGLNWIALRVADAAAPPSG